MNHPIDIALDNFLSRRRVKSVLLILSSWLVLVFGAWMLAFAVQGQMMGVMMAFVSLTVSELASWLILDLDKKYFVEHFDPFDDDFHD